MATILIVDNEVDNRLLFRRILQFDNHTILEVNDGQAALTLLATTHPQLILMDLSMPIMDGWTATREIKQQPHLRHIPIIAVTAHARPQDRESALLAGCDDYVSKPIDVVTFQAVITRWLSNTLSRGQ